MQAEIKGACWAVFDTEDLRTKPGPKLVELICLFPYARNGLGG